MFGCLEVLDAWCLVSKVLVSYILSHKCISKHFLCENPIFISTIQTIININQRNAYIKYTMLRRNRTERTDK